MTAPAKLLTVPDVSRWLNVSQGWVRDHAAGRRKPVLPAVKLGKSVRFREDQVARWLEEMQTVSGADGL